MRLFVLWEQRRGGRQLAEKTDLGLGLRGLVWGWKVTRLFGEAGGRGARAAGGRRGGKGPGARGCRLGARCAWVPHPALPRLGCWRVDVCTRCVGSGVAAGRELPEAEEGYWISRSSTGEGRGALSPGRESSGSHAFSPGRPARLLLEAGGLARPSGRALPAPLLQAPGSGWEARTWARTCKLVWVSCVTLGTLRLFHIFFFAVFFLPALPFPQRFLRNCLFSLQVSI